MLLIQDNPMLDVFLGPYQSTRYHLLEYKLASHISFLKIRYLNTIIGNLRSDIERMFEVCKA